MTTRQYTKEIKKCLLKEDVDELIEFVKTHSEFIGNDIAFAFITANRKVQEMTLRKMIIQRVDLPSYLRKRAYNWLKENTKK